MKYGIKGVITDLRQPLAPVEQVRIEPYRSAISYILASIDCGNHLHGFTPESINQAYCDDRLMVIAVAVSPAGIPVGYSMYRLPPHGIELCRIVVDREWRGFGVGRRLLDHVIGKLDSRRKVLQASVCEHDMPSLTFLRKMQPDRCRLVRVLPDGPDIVRFGWDRRK